MRQYQQNGVCAPHKPLLVMLVLTRLLTTGTSAMTWLEARRGKQPVDEASSSAVMQKEQAEERGPDVIEEEAPLAPTEPVSIP